MNNTNRALNRTLLIGLGLLFIAAGASAIAAMSISAVGQMWSTGWESARSMLRDAAAASVLTGMTLNGVVVGTVAVIIVVVFLLVFALTRVGGGRSRSLLRSSSTQTPRGRVIITGAFASDSLRNSLGHSEDIINSRVTTAMLRHHPVLRIETFPRRYVNPRLIAEHIDSLATNLHHLTGEEVDTYIRIRTSLRSRLASTSRRVD